MNRYSLWSESKKAVITDDDTCKQLGLVHIFACKALHNFTLIQFEHYEFVSGIVASQAKDNKSVIAFILFAPSIGRA